jgi:PAS domain S-box-containing protein
MKEKTKEVHSLAGVDSHMDPARELNLVRHALDKSAIVAMTDRRGNIIHVNDKFCEISQYSREELIGKNHRVINSGYHGHEFFVQMWKTISSGKVWEGEIRNRAKDGSIYWVNTTIVPFAEESGQIYQYVSIRYEITQRKQAEEQLRVYADQLELKNQELATSVKIVVDREAQILMQDRLASVGLLASSLAHEIGTPLGVIRGRAEYLEMKLRDNPEAIKTASVIISQIDRVSKLIRSLLNLARGDNARHIENVSPREILSELNDLIGHDFRKLGVEWSLDISPEAKVRAEFGALHQVFLNLLVNSLHAIETASKNGRQENFMKITCEDRNDFWAIVLADSGCGISEKNLKRLFQPFFTTKDIGKGTGLGLATSYRIVESWGGKIEVASSEQKGSTFTVLLPKA